MARFSKITNYKLQITNKLQTTMSKITNSPIGLKKTSRTSRRRRLNLSEGHPIVCNLGFVICNFPDKPDTFGFRLGRTRASRVSSTVCGGIF